MVNSNRDVDGVVSVLLDATRNFKMPLTAKRLFGWIASFFPTGYSGIFKFFDSMGTLEY